MRRRPFRDPHHSASLPALVGGGAARPARRGVAGPQGRAVPGRAARVRRARRWSPCASRSKPARAVVARANAHVTYPARFQLVAAMNPCRCGYLGDPGAGLRARAALRRRLPGEDLGAAVRPHRPARGGAGGGGRRPVPAAARRGHAPRWRPASPRRARSRRALRRHGRPAHPHQRRGRRQLLEEIAAPDAAGRALLTQAAER